MYVACVHTELDSPVYQVEVVNSDLTQPAELPQ